MYLQFRVHEDDINYQRILWGDSPEEPIKDYAINRLSFGLNFSPYGAIQTIHALADENESRSPEAGKN